MAFSHGKLATIWVDNAAGTLTNITAYSNEVSWPQEVDASEVTVFGDGNKMFVPGLGDSSVSIKGTYDPAIDTIFGAVRAAVIAGTVLSSSIEYLPAGTGTGNRKFAAEGVLTKYEPSSSVGDPNEWSAEYQITGAVTASTL